MSDVVVPYVALGRRAAALKPRLLAAVERVIDRGAYILGPEVEEFEQRFADYCGVRHAAGVADGTTALMLALRAVGVDPDDEVITAPNSFVASASSAALLGAVPRFVDVRRADMNLDPGLLEKAITPRTRAIVPVHLTGHPADMDAINAIAARHGVAVIEDAAQSIGSSYRGRRTGSLARLACFSLHPLKVLHAMGDAGVITTDDAGLADWLRKARNHGLRNRDEVEFWSPNARLDTIQAAILNVMFDHVDEWIRQRREIAAEFSAALADVVGVPTEAPDCVHTYQTFMIVAERRAGLLAHLAARGIDAKVHYARPIPFQAPARTLGYGAGDFPVTSWLADRIVSLPLYGEMTTAERAAVIEGVRSYYR